MTRGACNNLRPDIPFLKDRLLQGENFVPDEAAGSPDAELEWNDLLFSTIAAIAPMARLLPAKVLDRNGTGTDSAILHGLGYAGDTRAPIVVVALGMPVTHGEPVSPVYQEIVRRLRSIGSLPIGSAGNDNVSGVVRPVNTPGFLAVAATDLRDQPTDFSNFGPAVGLAAPGVGIVAAKSRGGLTEISGTSASCAITAGIAALVLTVRPGLTPDQLEDVLKRSCHPIRDGNRPTTQMGAGRIDALEAVRLAKNYRGLSSQSTQPATSSAPQP